MSERTQSDPLTAVVGASAALAMTPQAFDRQMERIERLQAQGNVTAAMLATNKLLARVEEIRTARLIREGEPRGVLSGHMLLLHDELVAASEALGGDKHDQMAARTALAITTQSTYNIAISAEKREIR